MAALPGRVGYDRIAEEQAALRRVATLVAGAAAPEEVFAAVAEEAGRLLGAHHATMSRYDPDGTARVVASWSGTGAAFPVGTCLPLGGRNAHTLVFQTHRPARISDYADASGLTGKAAREFGFRASVSVPVMVEGGLWGLMIVEHTREEPLPADTEARLAGFTELAATAIANAQAHEELRGFAEEQAALRRVATLVARGAPPAEVLTAVTEEAGRLLGTDYATMKRYDPDGTVTAVATWSSTGAAIAVGAREKLGGHELHTMVFRTGQPARIDDHDDVPGRVADVARKLGIRAAVGVPVRVEGRLWGVMVVASRSGPLPAGTEARLAGFTELAATAIANAEAQAALAASRAQLAASRARVVAAADETRRRIERDLHDGTQQRLISLALGLRVAQRRLPAGQQDVAAQWSRTAQGLTDAIEELREISRGLHPAVLEKRGLAPALRELVRRGSIPVKLDVRVSGRLPEPVETAAYYTVSEALTNTAKHADATTADIEVAESGGVLHVHISDDGRGGADFSHGSGLVGLKDRSEAIGGCLQLDSPPGAGTTLEITLPLHDRGLPLESGR
ncbi:MAG TPA: GAF domain-containing sensor histidine kinase [Streptosporangiaceae bacterium]|nr:GAF domain-containing sensor histidine kinase [Streptosporangiaceae bacterium]